MIKSKHYLYPTWSSMLARCNNPNNDSYHNYGGRGIRVCARWYDFANFLADMGNRPKGYSIERIDVNGDYEPSNCTWINHKQQMRNVRYNRRITFNGETLILQDWADKLGVSVQVLSRRLDVHNWSIEDALTIPVNGKRGGKGSANSRAKLNEWSVRWIKKMLTAGNKVKYLSEIFNVSESAINNIKYGTHWAHIEV